MKYRIPQEQFDFDSRQKKTPRSAIPGASVSINQAYSATTGTDGDYKTEAKSCRDGMFDFKKAIVVVSKAGYESYRQEYPIDSLHREQIGNESSSDGKLYWIPDIYLSP